MKIRTNVKAGGIRLGNHNETLARASAPAAGPRVKTRVKAGLRASNHNNGLVRSRF